MHSYPLKIPLGHTYSLKLGQTVPSPAPTSPRQQQLKLDMDLLVFLRLYFKDKMSTLLKITYFVSKNRMGNGAETLWAWFEKAF